MKNFNYIDELKEIIKNRQLVEVFLHGGPTFKVGYLLHVNEDYLTFAEISPSATFSGVILCRMDDIEWISSESIYLDELSKQITDSSAYDQALRNIESIKKFTPSGIVEAFSGTKKLIELTSEDETVIAGRIIGFDKQYLLVDEYYAEYSQRFARKFINAVMIIRMAIDVPWVRTIEHSLSEKSL